jgi:hypothetical protein
MASALAHDGSQRSHDPRFQLEPASALTQWLLFGLVLVLPLVLLLFLPGAGREAERMFGVANGHPWLIKLYAGLLLSLVLGGVFVLLWLMMRRHRLALDIGGLDLATSFYRRRLAWADLQLDLARVVSLGERPELKPSWKSNGFAMPGFRSGWFRNRKLAKLFVATAGGDRVLWVPTRLGYELLLQPRNPQATLQRMRELAAMAPGAGRG